MDLRNSMKHDTFHVSLLKPMEERPQKPPKPILMKGERKWLVDSIVDKCVCGRKHITQYQVQWKGYGSHEDTWELLKHLGNVRDHVVAYES